MKRILVLIFVALIFGMILLVSCKKKQSISKPPVEYNENTGEVYIPGATIVTGGREYYERAKIPDSSLALVISADSNLYFYSPILKNLDSLTLTKSKESFCAYFNKLIEIEKMNFSGMGIEVTYLSGNNYQLTNQLYRWVGIREAKENKKVIIRGRKLFDVNFLNLIKGEWEGIVEINLSACDTLTAFPPDTFYMVGDITEAVIVGKYFKDLFSGSTQFITQMSNAYITCGDLVARVHLASCLNILFPVVGSVAGILGKNLLSEKVRVILPFLFTIANEGIQYALSNSTNDRELGVNIANGIIRNLINAIIDALKEGKFISPQLSSQANEKIETSPGIPVILIIKAIEAIIPLAEKIVGDVQGIFADIYGNYIISGSGGETGIQIISTPPGAKIYLRNESGWICQGTEVTPHTFTGLTPSPYYSCFLYKDGYYNWYSEGWADSRYGTTDIVVTEGQITLINATLVQRFCQGINVALTANGGVASASGWASYSGYNATPDQANDGLSPTDFYSAGQGNNTFWGYYLDNCWLRIDFPSLKTIRTIVLDPQYGGQTYRIEGSTNGTDWFTLIPETYIPNTAKIYTFSSPISVIAIRAIGTSSGAPRGYLWRYMLSELEAWQY